MAFLASNPLETINIDMWNHFGGLEITFPRLTPQKPTFLKNSKFQHIFRYLQKVGFLGAVIDSKLSYGPQIYLGDGFIIFWAKRCLILCNNRGWGIQLTYIFDPAGNRVNNFVSDQLTQHYLIVVQPTQQHMLVDSVSCFYLKIKWGFCDIYLQQNWGQNPLILVLLLPKKWGNITSLLGLTQFR